MTSARIYIQAILLGCKPFLPYASGISQSISLKFTMIHSEDSELSASEASELSASELSASELSASE